MQSQSALKRTRSQDDTGSARFFARVLCVGSLLTILDCYWIVSAENRVVYELTDFSFFPTVLATLFSLLLVNTALRRYWPRVAFTDAEIASIYVMISVATALAGHDIVRQLVPAMAHGVGRATPENEWLTLFGGHLPRWLTVPDPEVLVGYYEGGEPFWTERNVRAWAAPFLAWSGFIIVLLFVMLCINVVVRKQLTEHERLNYPIAQMPIEVIGDTQGFLTNRIMWAGFLAAFGLEALSGLHYLYPAIPHLQLKYPLGAFFREKPWSGMGGLNLYVYPFAAGLGYIMPLDLSFSLWVFYLLYKAHFVALTAMGVPTGDVWAGDLRAGAWAAIAVMALWSGRRHIGGVVRRALGRRDGEPQPDDRLNRLAVIGLIVGGPALLGFLRLAGMSLWVGSLYMGIYMLLCIGMTRMRAEVGPPTHEMHGSRPDELMVMFAGTRPFGARNLTITRLLAWLSYGYRCHPMPHQLEAFKIGSALQMRASRLVVAMIVASVVGAFIAIGAHIVLYYKYRFSVWGVGEFGTLASWITNPRDPDMPNMIRVVFGFVFSILLALMKRQFLWFPLYPVGYAAGYGWAIGWMWFSIFLGWLSKRVLFSAGGLGSYRRALPIFLGMVFGQFIAGSLWSLVGVITGRNMYTLFP
jgi:hypothetical protein